MICHSGRTKRRPRREPALEKTSSRMILMILMNRTWRVLSLMTTTRMEMLRRRDCLIVKKKILLRKPERKRRFPKEELQVGKRGKLKSSLNRRVKKITSGGRGSASQVDGNPPRLLMMVLRRNPRRRRRVGLTRTW